jgi:hypothetical protein
MLNSDSQIVLERDILIWLDSAPNTEEVLKYASKLPPDYAALGVVVGFQYLDHLIEKKNAYFLTHNCEEFLEKLSELDQFEVLFNLRDFNARSVLKKINSGSEGWAEKLTLPSDVHSWAKQYIERIDSAHTLVSATEYQERLVILQSFLKAVDSTRWAALLEQLQGHFLREGEAHDAGRVPSLAERDEWLAYYKSLGLFPQDYCEQLADFGNYFLRLTVNMRLLDVLSHLVHSEGVTNYEEALLRTLKTRIFSRFILKAEGRRMSRMSYGDNARTYFQRLNEIWTVDHIKNNAAASLTIGLLREAFQNGVQIDIYSYLEKNIVIESVLDPEPAEVVLSNLSWLSERARVEVYIAELVSSKDFSEETKEIVRSLLKQCAEVFHTLEEMSAELSNIPDNTISHALRP